MPGVGDLRGETARRSIKDRNVRHQARGIPNRVAGDEFVLNGINGFELGDRQDAHDLERAWVIADDRGNVGHLHTAHKAPAPGAIVGLPHGALAAIWRRLKVTVLPDIHSPLVGGLSVMRGFGLPLAEPARKKL